MQHPSSITKSRILTVDALRGFALLGIMIVHFLYWYTAGPLPQELYSRYTGIGSNIARFFSEIFLSGKFFAFFSFLFGLSFYLQTVERKDGKQNVMRRFAWRITLLLLIGLLHHAFWQGDILSIYAPLGFLLLLCGKLSNRWVLLLGILLAVNIPGKVVQMVSLFSQPTTGALGGPMGDMAAFATGYDTLIKDGSWLQIFRFNLENLPTKFDFQINSGRLYITMGFFLLGLYVGRKQWFEKGITVKVTWRKICKRSAAISGLFLVLALGIFAANEMGKLGLEQNPYVGLFFSVLFDGFGACMTAFYISGLTLLMSRKKWQPFLFAMAPVGKMALTSYLVQTAFGLLLFWGVGLELYGKTSQGLNLLIAVGFFSLQVLFSRWWLQHFQYGIVEWLWRSATLLKWQALQKREAPVPAMQPSVVVISESAAVQNQEHKTAG